MQKDRKENSFRSFLYAMLHVLFDSKKNDIMAVMHDTIVKNTYIL